MDGPSAKEIGWIEEARRGDAQAYSALVQVYQERLIHAAYSFLGNAEDARDAAQETFLKAYERLDRFEGRSRFYTWLYRILANHCKDLLRRRKMKGWLSMWTTDADGEEKNLTDTIPDPRAGAAADLAHKETGERIRRSMDRLPERQRTAFVFRYLEGLSLEETAESMQLSVGAVKAHLWHAVHKMRRTLGDLIGEETNDG